MLNLIVYKQNKKNSFNCKLIFLSLKFLNMQSQKSEKIDILRKSLWNFQNK